MLTIEDRKKFVTDGFTVLQEAVAPETIATCVKELEAELQTLGVNVDDSSSWVRPVVRFGCPDTDAFAAAGTSPKLWEAYDILIGANRWWRRQGVGGSIPVRFPSHEDPGDAGWHIDRAVDGLVNVHSRTRGLLALFLFTDVGQRDAPTEVLLGSHFDVASVLERFGEEGSDAENVIRNLPPSTWKRSITKATGSAGDVYLCHPFLVHRATWPHRGTRPRMIAQPEIRLLEPFLLQDNKEIGAVEEAIVQALKGHQ